MKTKLQLIRKTQFGFDAVLAVLLVVGIVSYRSLLASAESERWEQHTHEVLEHLESLLSAMENMKTGYVRLSYRLHANCYITKPVNLDGFLTVVKSIDSFWLSVVKLPREALSGQA
jgi:hypothetical protein